MSDQQDLTQLTVKDLRQLAAEHDIPNRSKLAKQALIEALAALPMASSLPPSPRCSARRPWPRWPPPSDEPEVLSPETVNPEPEDEPAAEAPDDIC